MARKDIYHDTVKKALDRDEWKITLTHLQCVLAVSVWRWIWAQNV